MDKPLDPPGAPPDPEGPPGVAPRGRRSLGKLARDLLLLLVIAAMGLPFLVASVGEEDLNPEQEQLAREVRRAAFLERSSLSNSLASKVVEAASEDGGLRVRHRYYTFFALPWGWSDGRVLPSGEVVSVETGLSLDALF